MAYVEAFRAGPWSRPRVGISVGSSSTTSGAVPRMDESLLSRLVELGQLFFEDYGSELRAGTLDACAVFCSLPWISPPMLSADADGSVVANWEREGSCLTIKFLNRHLLHYAITFRDANGQLQRDWGPGQIGIFLNDNRIAAQIVRR